MKDIKESSKERESEEFEIKYNNNSILVLPSSNYNHMIKVFGKEFSKRKMQVDFVQPYLAYRDKSGRPIWLISHYESFESVYKVIKEKDF